MPLKFNIRTLASWFIIYYVVTDVIREIIDSKSLTEALEYQMQPRIMALTLSIGFIFFLYALSAYFVFFKFHNKKPFWLNLLFVLCLAVLIVGLRYLIEEVLFRQLFGFGNYRPDVDLGYYLLDNFYYVFQYIALGIIFYFWQYSKLKDERNNQLQLENQQMELDLLRSQTNPHFLFNTLNNIYSLVLKDSNKALDAIEKLSLLLRYSLYKTKNLVPLDDEISQIKNFIELESIRHKEPLRIEFKILGTTTNKKVPQFILLPFIENAIKHGKTNSEAQPLKILVEIEKPVLKYQVVNTVVAKEKDSVGGIGLENLKKRLELLFPKNHKFNTAQLDNIYKAELEIPIQ